MYEIDHFIERHILRELLFVPSARFAQMRPERVDSNLYSYHLSKLLKFKYISKIGRDYTLAPKGLAYVDRISLSSLRPRIQPKINTGILLKNQKNEILLTKRHRQPLLGFWGLPMGKLHESDESLQSAAERELLEKTGVLASNLKHVGGCYMRFYMDDVLISSSMSQIFMQENFSHYVETSDDLKWVDVKRFSKNDLIPGVDEIIKTACMDRAGFFTEINKVLK